MTITSTRTRQGPLRRALTGMACLAVAACGGSEPAGGGAAPAASVGESASVTKEGIRLSFAVQHADEDRLGQPYRRGDKVRISFQITDEVAGEGLNGLHLGAWLVPRSSALADKVDDEAALRGMVRKLIASDFGSGTWTNLNTFFFLTASSDRSVALMDPLLDSTRTRTKEILVLPGLGADMAFGPNDELVFVTVPETGQVAVIDTAGMTLEHYVPAGTSPQRVYRQPRTGNIWVGDDGGEQVFMLDGYTGELARTYDVGPGPKRIAFDGDGRYAFLCALDSGTVVQVATRDPQPRPLTRFEAAVSGLAFSDAGGVLYACLRETGELQIVQPDSGERRRALELPAGCGPIWASRDGRWLFVAERDADRMYVVDVSTNQLSRTIETGSKPTQVVFTDAYAHVYCAGSSELTAIQVSALSDPGPVPVAHIPIGQKTPDDPDLDIIGDQLAVPPTDNAVMVAQPAEKQLYFYSEGMIAPKGAYQNHSAVPLAVAVLDRSLRETGNGIYTTTVPIEYFGKVDVYAYLNDPTQLFARFELDVEPDEATLEQRKAALPLAVLEAADPEAVLPLGEAVEYRFRLLDPESGEALAGRTDVGILSYNLESTEQQRSPAAPMPDGSYKVNLRLRMPGTYQVWVRCPSANMDYMSLNPLKVAVREETRNGPDEEPKESDHD